MTAKEELKEDLVRKIEQARQTLNESIDGKKAYHLIYENSIELDSLIEQYMVSGF